MESVEFLALIQAYTGIGIGTCLGTCIGIGIGESFEKGLRKPFSL